TESPSIASKIFAPLERRNISVPMISGSTESNLSFVVKDEHLNEVLEIINENGEGSIRDIDVVRDVCIITVVGVGMQGTKGIAAKVFQTVAEEDVNIIMIAQGSSEVNISFIVKEEDGEKVVKAIHKRFIESS
ncbi:MAG TPA: ACT domain-containing protein, partial [Candidatus Altiarchaeales archaeon]|nr:ACT domain-containing protein [Candidatus Altiarchaeales archaeon]